MKNFGLKIIASILKSVVVIIILFFLLISLLSEKFPPDLALARGYINQLRYSSKTYSNLIHKSENYLNKESPESESKPISVRVAESADSDNSADSNNLNLEIKHIRSQLDRIEQQNNLILNSLKK